MPAFGPIPRRALIKNFRAMGFEGPFAGGKHQYMARDDVTVFIPNPHGGDIGRDLLARLLRQARISKNEWEAL
jgi:predicted RNA binding protein YcfA (HicA-like mRNA interferase family)